MTKLINRLSPSKFQISTEGVPNSELTLDFQPIIKTHNLSGSYFLIHFQAKPRVHREWGIYSSVNDNYYSAKDVVIFSENGTTLNLDEAKHNTVPTCVLYLGTSSFSYFRDVAYIGDNSKNNSVPELFPIKV